MSAHVVEAKILWSRKNTPHSVKIAERCPKMKVLLVADEFFAWGVYGGFGAFSRKLAMELVKKGHDVEVIIQRFSNQQKPIGETDVLDGIPIIIVPLKKLEKLRRRQLYKKDVDVLHSQCGEFDTWLTFRENPHIPRIVTFQDPRSKEELALTMPYEKYSSYPWYKALWVKLMFYLYKRAVQSAVVASQAKFKIPLVKEMFGLDNVSWLPNFVDVPDSLPKKADKPTCLFLGRLDPIKRPDMYCFLPRFFPNIDFYVLGSSHFSGMNERLRGEFKNVTNLCFMGLDAGRLKQELLDKSWILVNTSVYECLPVTFLEAAAHGCAILSCQNPDGFASSFGMHVQPSIESFRTGLNLLLENDLWRRRGEEAYEHAKQFYSTSVVMDQHIKLYKTVMDEWRMKDESVSNNR